MGVEKRFLFHANAVGVAGQIRRQGDTAARLIIPVQAASCLPTIGGYSFAHASGQTFFDTVSFDHAFTHAKGDFIDREKATRLTRGDHGENDSATETSAIAEVRGFRVANRGPASEHVLTCATAAAALQSTHARDGSEPSFRSLDAKLDGLALDGYELEVTLCTDLFAEYHTWTTLRDAYERNDAFYREHGELFEPAGASTDARGARQLPNADGVCYTTIVHGLRWIGAPHPLVARIQGNRIILRDFASIYLGELQVSQYSRDLTMVRIQLGSPDGGEVAAAAARTNGQTYPP